MAPRPGPIDANAGNVCVKRPGYGSAGQDIALLTNCFVVDIPDAVIHHYDAITPTTLPPRVNMTLIDLLQGSVASEIFDPKAVYDGRKNMYASHELRLGSSDFREFDIPMPHYRKTYKVKVTKLGEVNLEILRKFLDGHQSGDSQILTALNALNTAIRMEPHKRYPSNLQSFFTDRETKSIGGGIDLWRGYFHSVRPSIGRLLINVNVSTGIMYRPGALIDLCLDFFGQIDRNRDPNMLAPACGFPNQKRLRLQKFLSGMRITSPGTGGGQREQINIIKGLSSGGADSTSINTDEYGRTTVSQYYQMSFNGPLRYPAVLCVEVGNGAFIPLEMCQAPPGQFMHRQIPPSKTDEVVKFCTMKPPEKLQNIEAGRDALGYGQPEYCRSFGLNVRVAEGQLPINARVLEPPVLRYGEDSKEPSIKPRNGAWNVVDKRLYEPVTIKDWVVIVYDKNFAKNAVSDSIKGLVSACKNLGITVEDDDPSVHYEDHKGNIAQQLQKAAGGKTSPSLIVVILHDDVGKSVYAAVKNFGDIQMGIPTQCLMSSKCVRARLQYWISVCLKINVKLGGINRILNPSESSAELLTDEEHPTIVIGAHLQRPPPGVGSRPSFASVVGSIDGNCVKYAATIKVQESKAETIADLKDMCKHILNLHIDHRKTVKKADPPTRLIFYRNGVSEGQFQQILDKELPLIQAACDELDLEVKITLVVVDRKHHIRFKCQNDRDADRSSNCPAGIVVDKDIGHPTDFDFYLQSHGGVVGTSRPAHYSVLFDENELDADAMQSLSFTLCHVYARATKSVSIPAPVYYAGLVCARAQNHYDPGSKLDLSDTDTDTSESSFMKNFKPIHKNQEKIMYFS